jgi:hypothetical protein
MAIGARILSNNLSGKTTNVTFNPTSGGSFNLGVKTVPFNYYDTNPYGIYDLYFGEYDHTYSLLVPDPTPLELSLETEILPGSIIGKFNLISNRRVSGNVTLYFEMFLSLFSGGSVTISTGVTINHSNLTGQTIVTINEEYSNLTGEVLFGQPILSGAPLGSIAEIFLINAPTPTPTDTPTPTPTDTPTPTPTPTIDPFGPICVSDAGSSIVNGTYTFVGIVDGKNSYSNENNFIVWEPGFGGFWFIKNIGTSYYFSSDNVATPDLVTTWELTGPGQNPLPIVTSGTCLSPISGCYTSVQFDVTTDSTYVFWTDCCTGQQKNDLINSGVTEYTPFDNSCISGGTFYLDLFPSYTITYVGDCQCPPLDEVLVDPIITDNNEYISIGEGFYLQFIE